MTRGRTDEAVAREAETPSRGGKRAVRPLAAEETNVTDLPELPDVLPEAPPPPPGWGRQTDGEPPVRYDDLGPGIDEPERPGDEGADRVGVL